ncbi:MAG: hypothetical protein KDA24_28950 [Deltaproteobacteria bacterium]|nr:hypothetical protein [Deltaproteobacteria bacterium]
MPPTKTGLVALAWVGLLACEGPVNPGGQGTALPQPLDCVASVDGVLATDELPFVVGVEATYLRNEPGVPVAFDPAPSEGPDGTRWDFSEGPADVGATLSLQELSAEAWYAPHFDPDALVGRVALEDPELQTVWAASPGELRALGLVSRSPGAASTLMRYDVAPTMLRTPMEVGHAWGGQHTFRDARLGGAPNAGVEDWSFSVVDRGDVVLPGDLVVRDVMVLRTEVTRSLAVAAGLEANRETSFIQQWIGPCVGELARVEGTDPTLSEVRELRRLQP